MRRGTLLVALLFAAPAVAEDAGPAEPDAGEGRPGSGDRVAKMSRALVRRAGRALNAQGVEHLSADDPAAALQSFKEAYELLDERDAEVANNIGYAYLTLNDKGRAIEWYLKAIELDPRRGLAYQNLAEVYAASGAAEDLELASKYLARAREFLGNKPFVIRLQAKVAARQGRFSEARAQYLSVQPQGDRLFLEIGAFFEEYARPEEAIDWYSRVQGEQSRAEAQGRIRRLRLAQAVAEFELSLRTEGIPLEARRYRELAVALERVGDRAEAVRLLEEALALAPLYAEANVLLGDLIREVDPRRAELVWLRALLVNGRNVDALVRIADLHRHQGRPNAAASFLTRAVEVAPDRNDLRLRLAKAWRAAGRIRRALAHLETFVAEAPEGVEVREARALKRILEQAAPDVVPGAAEAPTALGESKALHLATRMIGEGRLVEALAHLSEVPQAQRGPAVYNLLAFVMRRLGRTEEAAAFYHASLAESRDQPTVLQALGEQLLDDGQAAAARAVLEEAEFAGASEAPLLLARMDSAPADRWPGWLWDALQLRALSGAAGRLEGYVADPRATYRSDASTLLRGVRGRVRAVWAATAVLGLALLVGLVSLGRRRWGGADLGTLVTRHPEAGPEVQRVLSAIRHEVLKHNTMMLTGLVEAISTEEEDVRKAAWARRSLLGPPDGGDRRDAASQRLRDYAAELARIGRGHGVRLNLRRKDPALSALLRGFALLEGAGPALDRYPRLGRGGRRRLQRRLERATRLLNVEGYEAVRALLDQLRVLRVDAGLLLGIAVRTQREPAFRGVDFAPVALEGEAHLPCAVAMPRHAFEDVLANLVRNAIQSTLRHAPDEQVHIGLGVQTEVDFITGLARVAFCIRDRSPHQLTAEMLRGRYIEEGLGITADAVSRYEGALDVVEDSAPWTKAVVILLPWVDDEDEEAS